MQLSCQRCGKAFERNAAYVAQRDARYCSNACRSERVTKRCPICNNDFSIKASHSEKRKTCSKKCYCVWQSLTQSGEQSPNWKGGKVAVSCIWCGKAVMVDPHKIPERKFCSRVCKGKWTSVNATGENGYHWKGGYEPYYGPDWKIQRAKARQRDKHTCQRCQVHESALDRELDVHHIRPFRAFGIANHKQANRLSNLISLCAKCHMRVENGASLKLTP